MYLCVGCVVFEMCAMCANCKLCALRVVLYLLCELRMCDCDTGWAVSARL